jgi:hypothetical protein
MRHRVALLLSLLLIPLLAACVGDNDPVGTDSPYAPDPPNEPVQRPVEPKEPPIVFNGNTTAPIETDTTFYALREDGVGLTTEIWFRFENQRADTLYIVNCRGQLAPALEKQVDDGWEAFWFPVVKFCLSPPIVMAPGGKLVDRLEIWGALPGHNYKPAFKSDDVEGVYRLVMYSVVFHYDEYRTGFGDPGPLEYRVSNTFFLDDPRR